MTGVNSQATDSVASADTLAIGLAPSEAFAMLDAVMVETLGMAMHNAVARQQAAATVTSAAVASACARILGAVSSPSEDLTIPPLPVPPPSPESPAAVIAQAFAEGEAAIDVLRSQIGATAAAAAQARADLEALAKDAAGSTAQPPSSAAPRAKSPKPAARRAALKASAGKAGA